jgi:prepilin-type N-terminal cleavage/methylation domain-containing protein
MTRLGTGTWNRQRGFTIIEALAALAVGAVMMVGLVALIDESMEDSKGQQTALYQAQIAAAATKYIAANYAVLQATATAAAPVKVDIAALKTTNFLSTNFNGTNGYGQTPCVLVLHPTADRLEALVVTEGGNPIPTKNLSFIATNSGQGGGFIPSANPGSAQGAFNSWQMPLTNYSGKLNCSGTAAGANHLATAIFFDGPGNLSNDFMYRSAVPGHPELNQMNTPLNMRFVAAEDSSDAVGTAGGCIIGDATSYGRIAVNATGAVLSCRAGVWRRQGSQYWKDPVANFAALNALSGNNVGDVRMVTDPAWPSPRAFTWNGTAWMPLAVDQNGDLSVPGTTSTGMVQMNQVVVAGTACSPTGLFARDANGLLLSCQFGVWTSQASTDLAYTETDYLVILPSTALNYPPAKIYRGAMNYDAAEDTSQVTITRKVTPQKNGVVILNMWSALSRELISDGSVEGQFYIVGSIRNDDNGTIIGTTIAKSPILHNDDSAISATLSKAVPKNANGYTVIIDTYWTVYKGSAGANRYNRANYRNAAGNAVELTPLQTGWTMDLFY